MLKDTVPFGRVALIAFCLLAISNAYAELVCVGISKEKYCIGGPMPNKSASRSDDGIYIQRGIRTKNYFLDAHEFDRELNVDITTKISTTDDKISAVKQTIEFYLLDNRKKRDVPLVIIDRLNKTYGETEDKYTTDDSLHAKWRTKNLMVNFVIFEDACVIRYDAASKQ